MNYKLSTISCLIAALVPLAAHGQDTLNVAFAGDVMVHQPQLYAAKTETGYSFDATFAFIKPIFAQADLVVANLETTLAGAPYSGYPAFCAPDELALALRNAGVGVLSTANNHTCDKGKRGVLRTLLVLDSLRMAHTGTFRDSAERSRCYPLLISAKNIKLALLCYTYGTNGLAVPAPAVVNLIDTAQIVADIAAAKAMQPDMIVALMHWGVEYERHPNKEQRRLAKFLQRHGVQLIVGGHPHVLQGMRMRYAADSSIAGAVLYSLGNFVSNQRQPHTELGAIATLQLIKTDSVTRIASGQYTFTWVYKPMVDGHSQYYILPAAKYATRPEFFCDSASHNRLQAALAAARELYGKECVGFSEN